ncbi:hypothetical protein FJT64_007638 [Amphibalanus amphitrite]|uniref:CUB domain-containing protein n=1 Tax=Amphibalanus amphitrite TaxID=1232801 RepID=A0A6A4VM63_AMPAM|nr:hypothetical protein FJT64_007638 [Amphibalanus amphitrite]
MSVRPLLTFGLLVFSTVLVAASPSPPQSSESSTVPESTSARDARLFGVFQLVRFPNEPCSTTELGTNGTCYLADECTRNGGRAMGTCARGYGVCCVFSAGCGEVISRNSTIFRGPGNQTAPFNCRLTVGKVNENICQLRLAFEQLSLAGPDVDGVCRQDQFSVTGASSAQPPVLCGVNSGSHMYVDVAPGSGSQVTLQVTTSGTQTANRDWRVRVDQIECSSPSLAPAGCLQYYTNVTGMVQSFGFDTNTNGPHLANQRYAICVRTNAGFCGIQYDACPAINNFTVSESLGAVKGAACNTDYITIVGVTPDGTTGTPVDRHCGTQWSGDAAGTSSSGVTFSEPFIVYVNFDATETTVEQEGSNRGFCLSYTQVPCGVSSPLVAIAPLVTRPEPVIQRPHNPYRPEGIVASSGILSVSNPAEQDAYDYYNQRRPGNRGRAEDPEKPAARGWQKRKNFYYG